MMISKIGFYVHHHGDGHRQRALAIAKQAPEYFTLIGTNLKGRTENVDYLDLEDDQTTFINNKKYTLKATHYTPLHHVGIKKRVAKISNWIADNNPSLLVVDVSVEIALLARLCSTPSVYVRLLGKRFDSAHLEAFRSAEALLCPFHPLLEHKKTPKWVIEKSHYFSGLTAHSKTQKTLEKYAVVVLGAGGHAITIEQLVSMARQLPDWKIDVIGPFKKTKMVLSNLNILGWVENAQHFISQANIVIGAAGDGLIGDVMAADKPYICLPQERPFAEQKAKAKRLKKIKAAIICKKWPENWPKTIHKALKNGSMMGFLHDEASVEKAAEFLLTLAHGANLSSTFKEMDQKKNVRKHSHSE